MSKIAYFETYACDEYGHDPRYAKVTVDQELIERMLRMVKVCKDNNLSECRIYGAPDEWNGADDLYLTNEELVVRGDSFWFVAEPKHASYHVETRGVDLPELEIAFNSSDSVMFFGNHNNDLKQLIENLNEGTSIFISP